MLIVAGCCALTSGRAASGHLSIFSICQTALAPCLSDEESLRCLHMVLAAVPLRAVSSCRFLNTHLSSSERALHDCLLTLSLQLFGQDPGFARTLTSLDLSGLPKLDDPCMVRLTRAAAAIAFWRRCRAAPVEDACHATPAASAELALADQCCTVLAPCVLALQPTVTMRLSEPRTSSQSGVALCNDAPGSS